MSFLTKLFSPKAKEVPKSRSTIAKRPVPPAGGAASATIVRHEGDLPPHTKLLSGREQPLYVDLADHERSDVVIVDNVSHSGSGTRKVCQVFCTSEYAIRNSGFGELQVRLKKKEFDLYPPVPTRTTKEVIAMLISKHEKKLADGIKEDNSEMEQKFLSLAAEAAAEQATDIHIEIRGNQCEVKFRIYKQLQKHASMSGDTATTLLRTIYQAMAEPSSRSDSSFNITDRQTCAIDRIVGGKRYRFRYQHAPINPQGCDAVMRLLPIGQKEEDNHLSFPQLGYTDDQSALIEEMFSKPEGVVLIAGTTGSGKSTTLKHGITGLINARPQIKVRTIEDPPEYVIHGASQTPVSRSDKDDTGGTNKAFEATIKAVMRMDPDFIMIGEVRDPPSASLLTKAVQSGHQVASTVHADSAIGIIGRLANLGVSRDILAGPNFITGLIYQKLLPTLCEHCKVPMKNYVPKTAEKTGVYQRAKKHFSYCEEALFFRSEKGCKRCKNRGLTGMSVCAEVVRPDATFLGYVLRTLDIQAQEYWLGLKQKTTNTANGMLCMEHGLIKLKAGIVSPEDFEAAFGMVTEHLLRGPAPAQEIKESGVSVGQWHGPVDDHVG